MPYSIFFLRGYAIHGSYETNISGDPLARLRQTAPGERRGALFAGAEVRRPGNTVITISFLAVSRTSL